MTDELLKEAFHKELITLCKKRNKEIKYKSSRLLDLINKYGGYDAAIKHVETDINISEFTLLWEQERLDLSIEALVTQEKYKVLFPPTVFDFCETRLEKFNYAPNRLEEEQEEKKLKLQIEQTLLNMKMDIYVEGDFITLEQWKESFMDDKIFTEKNKDMIMRMYLMGGKYIEATDLGKEEGYSSSYPYEGVTTALGKRLKNTFKLETPHSKKGKLIWWPILFTGIFDNNKSFMLSLRKRLREAIAELIEEGKLDIAHLHVQTHKTYDEKDVQEEEAILQKRLSEVASRKIIEAEHKRQEESKKIEAEKIIIKENTKEDTKENIIDSPKSVPKIMDVDALMSMMFDDVPSVATQEIIEPAPIPEEKEKVEEEKIEKTTLIALREECIEYYGAICEVCGFDYGYVYGDEFEKIIPIHNLKGDDTPVDLEDIDPHKDLVPVCHNCHEMLHRQNPPYTIEALKKKIEQQNKNR